MDKTKENFLDFCLVDKIIVNFFFQFSSFDELVAEEEVEKEVFRGKFQVMVNVVHNLWL